MSLSFRTLQGAALEAALGELAELRLTVFRDYPYLYDGDAAYERHYLASYRDSPEAILVAAYDNGRIVGASTGMPLSQHDEAFVTPIREAGFAPDTVFYCAESVLLKPYRGQGAGHVFFDMREAHARALGAEWSVFCGVVRDDPPGNVPSDDVPLAPFWHKRGYKPLSGVFAMFNWREVGQATETAHRLDFWCRKLT